VNRKWIFAAICLVVLTVLSGLSLYLPYSNSITDDNISKNSILLPIKDKNLYPFVKEDGFILANFETYYTSGVREVSVYDTLFHETGKMLISGPLRQSILISKDKQIIFAHYFLHLMDGNVPIKSIDTRLFFNFTAVSSVGATDYMIVGDKIYIALQGKGVEHEGGISMDGNVFIKVEGNEIVKLSEIHQTEQSSRQVFTVHYDNKFYLPTPHLPFIEPTKVRLTSFDPETGIYENYEYEISSRKFENYQVERSDLYMIEEGVLYRMYSLIQDNSVGSYAFAIENMETKNARLFQTNTRPLLSSSVLTRTDDLVKGYSVVSIYANSSSGYYLGIGITPHKENEFTPIISPIEYLPTYFHTSGTATGKLYFSRYDSEIAIDIVYPNQLAQFINQYLSLPSQITLVGVDVVSIVYLIVINVKKKRNILKTELYPKEK